jgi:hypothetical protein
MLRLAQRVADAGGVQAGDAERGDAGQRRANDTIEHGVAPACEGPQEDTSYYRGFASLHDQVRRADTRPGRNITPRSPGTASADPRTILKSRAGRAGPADPASYYRYLLAD